MVGKTMKNEMSNFFQIAKIDDEEKYIIHEKMSKVKKGNILMKIFGKV